MTVNVKLDSPNGHLRPTHGPSAGVCSRVVTMEKRSRDNLRELVTGKSDDALYDAIGSDFESLLDEVFEAMAGAFVPERAGDASGVVQWNIGTPQGIRCYQLAFESGRCQARRGDRDARVTLTALLPDFLRIAAGQLDPMEAYFKRAMTASGDLLFAKRQEAWFER